MKVLALELAVPLVGGYIDDAMQLVTRDFMLLRSMVFDCANGNHKLYYSNGTLQCRICLLTMDVDTSELMGPRNLSLVRQQAEKLYDIVDKNLLGLSDDINRLDTKDAERVIEMRSFLDYIA